jgi:hypothetical protein
MCLHIDLKYERTERRVHITETGSREEYDCRVYKCIICGEEFDPINLSANVDALLEE